MAEQRQLTISNPAIGGSGYLTLANMEADSAITAGYHAAIHQCRGLAQAGGPLCVDVMIREHHVSGAVPRQVDYVNGFELAEAWRAISEVKDFEETFPRGLTVVSDYLVEEPILVATSRRGPRYHTKEEFVDKFKELIAKGRDLRLIVYNFAHHGFPVILKGPFSLGVITADLHIRADDRFIDLPADAAIEGILQNVPSKGGKLAYDKRRKFNQHVFETGYETRMAFPGPKEGRVIMI